MLGLLEDLRGLAVAQDADSKLLSNGAPADSVDGRLKLCLPQQGPVALELIIAAPRLLRQVALPDGY